VIRCLADLQLLADLLDAGSRAQRRIRFPQLPDDLFRPVPFPFYESPFRPLRASRLS
jgi:hypothetical protein